MSVAAFRRYLPGPDDARVASIRGFDAYSYRDWAERDPFASSLIAGWRPMYPTPFTGVTSDGRPVPELYVTRDVPEQERPPAAAMAAAARALIAACTPEEAARLRYPLDAQEWQSWANPEFLQHDTGVRLEFSSEAVRIAALALVDATFAPEGAALVRRLMRINGYLGSELGLEGVMNAFSYNVAVYGEPREGADWGWQLFGHHVAINAVLVGDELVVTPMFLGAEPTTVDSGPDAGAAEFVDRTAIARALMAALPEALRAQAITYPTLVDPAMPEGRVHPGDERHLGGAFQDNRIIPYEGVLQTAMPAECARLLDDLVAAFVDIVPSGVAARRRREIVAHRNETWFSWIGGWAEDEPFYFRIQSPVVLLELDHHAGVFLTNTDPMAFHIHTVMRTPNGNDYGKALLAPH